MGLFEKYVEYHKGSIPLIISVPHGGTEKLKDIPSRKEGIVGIDKNTINLALELIKKIENLYQLNSLIYKSPSYIILKVHRSKIDINRNESRAYNENSNLARKIYQYYHNKLEELIYYNLEQFNHSLLVDIHGFEKADIPKGFRDVELILGTNNLETMFSEPIPKKFWADNLRGKIIKKFINLGISIAPGHQRRREYALTGGFITQKYGASKIKNSQAIQIEFSDRVRIYDKNLRYKIISTLAELLFNELL